MTLQATWWFKLWSKPLQKLTERRLNQTMVEPKPERNAFEQYTTNNEPKSECLSQKSGLMHCRQQFLCFLVELAHKRNHNYLCKQISFSASFKFYKKDPICEPILSLIITFSINQNTSQLKMNRKLKVHNDLQTMAEIKKDNRVLVSKIIHVKPIVSS